MASKHGEHHGHHDHGHHHAHACDCAGHRALERLAPPSEKPSLWSSLLPVLACAVCPACLATYAKLFSVAGVGLGLDEAAHATLLFTAVIASVGLSAWRSWRTKRAWPVSVALVGCSLLLAGHLAGGAFHGLEWAGVITMLVGGLAEHIRLVHRPATSAA